jgi:hypothetical protein
MGSGAQGAERGRPPARRRPSASGARRPARRRRPHPSVAQLFDGDLARHLVTVARAGICPVEQAEVLVTDRASVAHTPPEPRVSARILAARGADPGATYVLQIATYDHDVSGCLTIVVSLVRVRVSPSAESAANRRFFSSGCGAKTSANATSLGFVANSWPNPRLWRLGRSRDRCRPRRALLLWTSRAAPSTSSVHQRDRRAAPAHPRHRRPGGRSARSTGPSTTDDNPRRRRAALSHRGGAVLIRERVPGDYVYVELI